MERKLKKNRCIKGFNCESILLYFRRNFTQFYRGLLQLTSISTKNDGREDRVGVNDL